jgi:hypothetical protein
MLATQPSLLAAPTFCRKGDSVSFGTERITGSIVGYGSGARLGAIGTALQTAQGSTEPFTFGSAAQAHAAGMLRFAPVVCVLSVVFGGTR